MTKRKATKRRPKMKASDRRLSPEFMLAPVRELWGGQIPFDAFTEPTNPTRAGNFCTGPNGSDSDGFTALWHSYRGTWAQPPFSRMPDAVGKCVIEAHAGAEILFLSRADNRTSWFRVLAANADARCNIARSVPFIQVLRGGGLRKLSGDFYAYTIWYFGRRRRRFDRLFTPLGEVIHGLGLLELELPQAAE
jgi:hypothetical protein